MTKNAWTLVALGLVGCAAVVWWFWWLGADPSLVSNGSDRPSAVPRHVERDVGAGVAPPTAGSRDTEAVSRVAVAAASEDAEPQIVRLLVLLPDEQPAVDAEVLFRPPGKVIADGDEDDDLEVMLRRHGAAARTDERGRVDFVAHRDSDLCARCSDFYGRLDLQALGNDATQIFPLVLQRDVTPRVLVVDAAGTPREGIVVRAEAMAASRVLGSIQEISAHYRTDARGLATLPHLQQQLPMPGADVVRWQLWLACHPFDAQSASVQVAPHELTREQPFRLVVPTGGSILARVLDADGKPWFGGSCLRDFVTGDERVVHHNDLRDGTQWFRQVPLGGSWQVRCETSGETVTMSSPFAGPTRPDEVVTVDVTVPQRTWHVSGRLVRPDGIPLPRTRITCRTRHVADDRDVHHGTFHFLRQLPASIEAIDDLTLAVHLDEAPTLVRIERTLHPGRTDLGDVVVPIPTDDALLAAVEVRCEGRVVSADAAVWIWSMSPAGKPRAEVFSVQRQRGTEIELYGQAPHGQLELRCHCRGCRGVAIPIAVGERRVVELPPLAELCVCIRPPLVPRRFVHAQLVRGAEVDECLLEPGDQFHWENLEPGRYALRIVVDTVVCFELPDLEVHPGAHTWPADGSRLDLHDRVRAFHLDIRPADGIGVVEDAEAFVVPPHVSAAELDAKPLPAANWFIARPQPVDVLVRAPGFVPTRLRAPTRDLVVPLTRCTTVEVIPHPDPDASTVVRVVEHGLDDPVLRAIGEYMLSGETQVDREGQQPLFVAPGTVLDVVVEHGGNASAPRRVVVGTTSPQVVDLR